MRGGCVHDDPLTLCLQLSPLKPFLKYGGVLFSSFNEKEMRRGADPAAL